MAPETLTVRRMVILPQAVLLYGIGTAREISGPPTLQYTVTIGDVITYEPVGVDYGQYVAVAPAVRPTQP
jgi:hypothetical protein